MAAPATERRRGSAPRALDAAALDRAALDYLARFASSSVNLRRVLARKVARAAAGAPSEGGAKLVEDLIARYLRAGLLDDRAYAGQLAASLIRRGTSRFAIAGRLAQKGVAAELIAQTLAGLDATAGDSEIAAACALARRRRLGPYRAPPARAAARNKDLAALARAGFSLGVARRIVAAADVAALEALARSGEDSG
jgi:regulatory protein